MWVSNTSEMKLAELSQDATRLLTKTTQLIQELKRECHPRWVGDLLALNRLETNLKMFTE